MLIFTRRLMLTLLILNWIAAAMFVLVGVAVAMAPETITGPLVARFGDEAATVRYALLIALAIGLAAAPAVHLIFTRLIAMIDTVRAGTPFAGVNADRLRHVAWAVLALQLLDLGFGVVATRLSAATGEVMAWQFSLTGWLAVLLLFVLARVFQQGAAMQDEIEGTV
ncbi:MAG: DUF2975 domain-containing protein [Sphingomonas sp.]